MVVACKYKYYSTIYIFLIFPEYSSTYDVEYVSCLFCYKWLDVLLHNATTMIRIMFLFNNTI